MTDNEKASNTAASLLQQTLDEERAKRVKAENYAQALVEEFTSCSDFDEVRKTFRDKVKEFAPQALINIVTLANGAESESVRANLNKWIIEWAMSDKIEGGDGELRQFLKGLQKQEQTPQGTS